MRLLHIPMPRHWACARWLQAAAAVAVGCALLAFACNRPVGMPDASVPRPAPLSARMPSPLPAVVPPPADAPSDAAMRLLACRQREGELAAQVALGDATATAAAMQLRNDTCAGGRATPLQIEAALRSAAARGDVDAQRYLLTDRARVLLERSSANPLPGDPVRVSGSDAHELQAIVAELELHALRGERAAIDALAQVLESSLSPEPEPAYAAAWRLAARQDPARPFPAGGVALGEEELLDGLNEEQRQQALALAPELFAQCCRGR